MTSMATARVSARARSTTLDRSATPRGVRGLGRLLFLTFLAAPFFLAFVPQFLDPAAGQVALQFAVLGSVSVLLNTLVDVVVAFAAARIRSGVAGRAGLVRRLREASGGAMIALGLGLALARRPTG